jgi:capsular exopolysaccharide synthesis family protein
MEISGGTHEVDLQRYVYVLRRWKWKILLIVAVCVGVSLLYSSSQTPIYEATASILLQGQTPNTDPQAVPRVQPNLRQIELEFFQSEQVVAEAHKRLGYPASVKATASEEGVVLDITAANPDPQKAADIANTYAQAYIDLRLKNSVNTYTQTAQSYQKQISDLAPQVQQVNDQIGDLTNMPPSESRDAELKSLLERRDALDRRSGVWETRLDSLNVSADMAQTTGPQIIHTASVPTNPVTPQPRRDAGMALTVGLMLGCALALLLEYLDDSIRTKEDLQRVTQDAPVLAMVPTVREWKDRSETHVIAQEKPSSPTTEAYRALRTSIQFAALDQQIRTLQFTSPSAGEGKTTTTTNLGVVFARAGQRVVLVDCDLRRPRLHTFFGMSNEIGFTSVLLGEVELASAVQPVPGEPNLMLLASGPCPPDPSELLSKNITREIIEALASASDFVLIDSPPVLPVTDALILSDITDALILVTKSGRTKKRDTAGATDTILRLGAPLIGTVLNDLSAASSYGYNRGYGYGYEYGYSSSSEPRSRRGFRLGRRAPRASAVAEVPELASRPSPPTAPDTRTGQSSESVTSSR